MSGRFVKGNPLHGNVYRLAIKYFAFLLSAFVSPYFYSFMWRFHGSRSFRIAGGLTIALLVFTVILIVGESFPALPMRKERPAASH